MLGIGDYLLLLAVVACCWLVIIVQSLFSLDYLRFVSNKFVAAVVTTNGM